MTAYYQYQEELFAQKTPYLQWLWRRNNALKYVRETGKPLCVLPFLSCTDRLDKVLGGREDREKNYLFVREDGVLQEGARGIFAEAFAAHPNAKVIYADEDYYGTLSELYGIADGEFDASVLEKCAEYGVPDKGLYRGEPWFKPDFSPDTLESFFYIGSIFAVRGAALAEAVEELGDGASLCAVIRAIARKITSKITNKITGVSETHGAEEFVHIPEVLYTNHRLDRKDELEGLSEETEIKTETGGASAFGRLSVIIPSKDNPEILKNCITSFVQCAENIDYELIVVDNGSTDENRALVNGLLQEWLPKERYQYLYQKMEFNFSKMCNMGAAARGEYLLFLNDDITVPDGQDGAWLEKMLRYASMAHVGAVGLKLRYPKEDLLQHTGITNMKIGPAHKLCGLPDRGNLYHGHNLVDYDMLAVTAACMLLSQEKFERAGGFDEELAVAYNDVELCFRLYRSGLYNVQVNSAFLLHHESLSRGSDDGDKKRERLLREKKRLYEKHPWAMETDPFYSPHLVQWEKDVAYHVDSPFSEYVPTKPDAVPFKELRVLLKWEQRRSAWKKRGALFGRLFDKLTGAGRSMLTIDRVEIEEGVMTVTGWHVLRGCDNANLVKRIWIYNERKAYAAKLLPILREDAAALFADDKATKNTALSGICVRLDLSEILDKNEGTDKIKDYKIAVVTKYGKNGKKPYWATERI